MHLLIMRHGEAGWHSLDHQRELTEAGRQGVATVAGQIAHSSWRPDLIWASPLTRARQTAAIVAEILNCRVERHPFLTPDDDPGECLNHLLESSHGTLMVVSHMPLVGSLATLLVDGHRRGIPFMTSQAVLLEMPVAGPGCADVRAQYLP